MNPQAMRSGWVRSFVRVGIGALGACLVVLLLCLPALAQGNFGHIIGTVADQSGGVIAGATVNVIDVDRGVTRSLTTDSAGEYNAPELLPGKYTVHAEAKGFKVLERQNVFVEVGKESRVDLTLQPGEQMQTIVITEQLPLVETTNATLGGTLNTAEIGDMPLNGRNYQFLLALRPGVMLQPGGGPWTQSTNGVRPDESLWMVDGVINSNFFDARPILGMSSPITDAATILPVDAIQEFNTMENPKAEYGWKPGAVVNVGIKSGTNGLHGSAYAFGRTDSWGARNAFNIGPSSDGSCLAGKTVNGVSPCDETPASLKQFGGVVGGPILKDKLFFFGGYEGLRSIVGNALVTHGIPETLGQKPADPTNSAVDAINALLFPASGSPTPVSPVSKALAGCTTGATAAATMCTGGFWPSNPNSSKSFIATVPNTNTSNNGIGKLDYRINSKNTLNGLLAISDYVGDGIDHPFVTKDSTDSFLIRTWTVTENWVWTPSTRIVNEMRFGYNRMSFIQINDDAGLMNPLNTGLTVPGLTQIDISGFNQFGTQHNRPQSTAPNPYYDFQDSVSYLVGKHNFKFGGEFAHIEADSNVPDYGRGRVDFNGGNCLGGTATPLEDFFCGSPSTGRALVGNASRVLNWTETAGFIQDDWHMSPRFTLNFGLRYSYQSPIKDSLGLWANFDPKQGLVQQGKQVDSMWSPDTRDFSPRVGFAWDVSGKGTTVVRGGYSLMYSTFTAVMWMSQNSFQNSSAVSLAANSTGATINTTACVAAATCTPIVASGGNIQLGVGQFNSPTFLCWDPMTPVAGSACSGGQATVFPAGQIQCGDGLKTAAGAKDPSPCPLMAVDPNLRTPRLQNFSLGIQHQFGNNLSLEVGYVGNHGSRLTSFNDINQPPGGAAFPGAGALVGTALSELAWCSANIISTTPKANIPTYKGTAITCTGGDAQGSLAQQARPLFKNFPYIGFINEMQNRSRSNYNSLQATLSKRLSHGLSFIAGYTYGHGTDDGSLNRYALLPQDATNLAPEYGNGDFDVRHRFTLTATYNIPGIKGFGQILEGWQLNSIVTLQSAQPWSVNDYTLNNSGTFDNADRWDFTGDPSGMTATANTLPFCKGPADPTAPGAKCTLFSDIDGTKSAALANSGAMWTSCVKNARDINTLVAFGCYVGRNGNGFLTPPPLGGFGNEARNNFRDSGFRNWDFSVFKNFRFKERYGVQFRAEFFNVLNHPIPANPYGASNNASNANNDPSNDHTAFGGSGGTPDVVAGNPLSGSGVQRTVQLGLKLTF